MAHRIVVTLLMLLLHGHPTHCRQAVSDDIIIIDTAQHSKDLHDIARCMIESDCKKLNLQLCYKVCIETATLENVITDESPLNFDLDLLCRDDTSLMLNLTTKSKTMKFVAVITVQDSKTTSNQPEIFLSNSLMPTISHLNRTTIYNVTVEMFAQGNRFLGKTKQFETLWQNYFPGSISSISVNNFVSRGKSLDGQVMWRPNYDLTCWYEILMFSEAHHENLHVEVVDVKDFYNCTMHDLMYDVNYQIAVRGLNSHDYDNESPVDWLYIRTPTCLEMNSNDYELCPPETPVIISTHETLRNVNVFDVTIEWEKPRLSPYYYLVEILDLSMKSEDTQSYLYNITGNLTQIRFDAVTLLGLQYEVHVRAFTNGGDTATSRIVEIDRDVLAARSFSATLMISVLTIGISVFLFGLVAFIFIVMRRNKAVKDLRTLDLEFSDRKLGKFFIDIQDQINLSDFYNDTLFEISRENLRLSQVLGEGAFGVVKRGVLTNNSCEPIERDVAAKMLKNNHTIADLKEFIREIEVMKSVEEHPNIVGILGHCTRDIKDIILITEYCANGNLREYLSTAWLRISNRSYTPVYTFEQRSSLLVAVQEKEFECDFNLNITSNEKEFRQYKNIPKFMGYANSRSINQNIQNGVTNRLYDELAQEICSKLPPTELTSSSLIKEQRNTKDDLTHADLLSYALQISQGMEFLAKNKIVHRDLAARNVLVCDKSTVKIADFGLSRDIYQESLYTKTGAGKLPLKWLAIESMERYEYTSQSDVWSFGVLLYEIVTLGGSPYPGLDVDVTSLFQQLKAGYRMKKPDNCSKGIYDLMCLCWEENPLDRPTFIEISAFLNSENWEDLKFDLIAYNKCRNETDMELIVTKTFICEEQEEL